MTDYKCARCGRQLADLDEVCQCGNALGVIDHG
jgi:DNA-directed RNA polymerase subunit RPC12/RpoP